MTRLIFCFILMFLSICSYAQSPQKMSYQMVIRNNSNNIVANQSVQVKISILQGTATGTTVYTETHQQTTNVNGLASFIIGDGTIITGSISNINWANGPYFIKTEADPTGGTNYTISGTTQLLSVPYALYAENTANKGKTYLILEDSITNADAAAIIEEEAGINTQFLWIRNTHYLTSVDLSKIKNLVELHVENNNALTQLSLPNLTNIRSTIRVNDNNNLQSISIPGLASFPVYCLISGASLSSISFPAVAKAKSNLTIYVSSSGAIALPLLQQVNGVFKITGGSSISLPALQNVNGSLNIYGGSSLDLTSLVYTKGLIISGTVATTLSLPQYLTCEGLFEIKDNQQLTSINLPQLQQVGITGSETVQMLKVTNNSLLNSLFLPNIVQVRGSIEIKNNNSLANIAANQLTHIYGHNEIYSNPLLSNITIPSVTYFGFNGTSFGFPNPGALINFGNNKLPSTVINNILSQLVNNVNPPIVYRAILLKQNPAAPPTGQGLSDKATLQSRPNNVDTD